MRGTTNDYEILVGKPEGNRYHLEALGVDGGIFKLIFNE